MRFEVRITCRDYGVVCIRREGQDIGKIISSDEILTEYKENIKIVDEVVPNRISLTRVRNIYRSVALIGRTKISKHLVSMDAY